MSNCTPYQQAEVSDCKKINFIFGANGSGKSTISSFLAGATDSRFSSSFI
ncbi:AAA family ATPase, partial [Sphaerochaeta sp. S2]